MTLTHFESNSIFVFVIYVFAVVVVVVVAFDVDSSFLGCDKNLHLPSVENTPRYQLSRGSFYSTHSTPSDFIHYYY